jgi:hypothetical protein
MGCIPTRVPCAEYYACSPSGPVRQNWGFSQGRNLVSSSRQMNEDESKIARYQGARRASFEGHPPGYAPALFCGRQDPDCAGWASQGGQHSGTVPARGHCPIDVLGLVQRFLEAGKRRLAGTRHGRQTTQWRRPCSGEYLPETVQIRIEFQAIRARRAFRPGCA